MLKNELPRTVSEMSIEDTYVNDHSFWDDMDSGENNMLTEAQTTKVYEQKPSLQFQTILAVQQLGLVISVILMVTTIFMVMIFLEKSWNMLVEYYNKRFGEEDVDDAEDPAALVGTFKRYKNNFQEFHRNDFHL